MTVDHNAIEPAGGRPTRAAWALLEHAPASADPFLQLAFRWIRPLIRPFLPVELRHGRTRGGQDGTVLVIGRGRLLEYLSRRFFAADFTREPQPPVAVPHLRELLLPFIGTADLVLALVPRVMARHIAGDELVRVPALVGFTLATAEVADFEAASQTLRSSVRHVRRSALVSRVSQDPAEFQRFYSELYLPTTAHRHGDLAELHPLHVLRRRFRFGGILWVERDGVSLGGNLYEIRGKTINMLVSGQRSSGDASLDAQVNLAGYLFALDLARELRCDTVNLGGTLPVLTNGVFRYKRAWGARVAPRAETHSELLAGWQRPGAAVLRLLADAPLIYRAGESLAAVAAIDPGETADPREGARLHRASRAPGIDGLTIMAPHGWAPAERGWALPPPSALRLAGPMASAEMVRSAFRRIDRRARPNESL